MVVLGTIVGFVGLEPSPLTLDVFVADPVADRPAPAPAAPAPGIAKPAGPRQTPISRTRPPVVARPRAAPAPEPPARAPVSVVPAPGRVAFPDPPESVDGAGFDGLAVASVPGGDVPPTALTPAKALTPIQPLAAAVGLARPELALLELPVARPALAAPTREMVPAESTPSDTLATESSEPGLPATPPAGREPVDVPVRPTPATLERTVAPPAQNAHAAASEPVLVPVTPPPRPAPPVKLQLPASLPLIARSAPPPADTTAVHPGGDVARAETPASSPVGSALGLGLGRLRLHLDGARLRTTTRDVEVITGTFAGGATPRVAVLVGDVVAEPRVDGRVFSAAVPLQPGLNHVRVVARDTHGDEVEETLTVQYAVSLAITSPRDGYTLTPEDPPLVVVQGHVNDPAVSSVWLVAGALRVAVPVVAGRFRHTVPVLAPTVPLRVETPAAEGQSPVSATITVHTAPAPIVALLLRWPGDTAGPADVAAAWRPRPDRLDGSVQRVVLRTAEGEASPYFFYLRDPKPGVYTFVLTYPPGTAQAVQPALYLPNGGGGLRMLKPVTLNASGRVVLARVLMPQGILWEQDDWFTGRSASGDAITKFRFPDGITWTERIGTISR